MLFSTKSSQRPLIGEHLRGAADAVDLFSGTVQWRRCLIFGVCIGYMAIFIQKLAQNKTKLWERKTVPVHTSVTS